MAARRAPLEQICDLPSDFHEAGVMTPAVLRALHHHASSLRIDRSVETGCGKSTLLLSWLSEAHAVFTLAGYGDLPCRSYHNVRSSPLLRSDAVEFVLGPTQQTLGREALYPIQLALIDGPHGFPFPMLEYYAIYPALQPGGLLIIDDVHIPTVAWLRDFLAEDRMFELVEQVGQTAFFRRTSAPTFNPLGDDWWLQNYNRNRFEQRAHWLSRAKRRIRGVARRLGFQ